MKRKLRIEELSVASFTTGEESTRERGTVRGMADTSPQVTLVYGSCAVIRTCDFSCQGVARTCVDTCANTCPFTCATCVTCQANLCP